MPDSILNNQTVNETRTPEMIAQGLQLVEEVKENVWLLVDPETGKQYYAKTAEPQELEMTKRAAEIQLPEDSPLVIAKPLATGNENIPPALAQEIQADSSRPEFIIMEAVPKGISFSNLLYPPPGKPSDLSSLDGKPITAEEYQSYIETLRAMNEQGVFNHDLASNTEIVRGEDGKLRIYAYDFEPQSFRPMYAHPHEDYAQAVDNGERMIQKGVLSQDAAAMLSQHDVTERASSAASLRTAEEQHAHQSSLGIQDTKTPEIPKLDPWDVPAFDVGKNPNETIFQNSERPVSDLLADAQASGQNKINRKDVPLTPERKLYHEVIVQLVTTRSFDDEHQLKAAVDAIKSSPEYERAIKSENPQEMQKAVEGMIATNEATKDLKPLDTHAAKDRQVVVMMGGSGTGKSSVRNVLVADMKERGVDPGVVIDADAFKELLGDSKKMGLEFADLTHQESSLIVDKIRGRLDDMVKTTGKAPNAIIDKTSATPAHLEDLAKTAGTVEVHCTYCPVEEAVSRAGARGEKTGRYVPTKMILEINKEVSAGVQKLLADPNVNITIYDTDVKYGEPPKVILEKAPGSNDVVIYDINKAAGLINQQEINSKAKSPDQLYADSNKKPLSEIISALAQNGQDIVIKNPGTNETIAEIRDKKLIISDEQSFRNLIGSQEADKLVHLTSEKSNLGAENDRQRQQTADSQSNTVETGVAESGKERQGHGEERRPKSSSDIASGEPHSTGNSGREVEPRQRGSVSVESPSVQPDGNKPKGNIDFSGKGVGAAGLATRANALKEGNMGADEKALNGAAIAADAIDTFSDTKLGKRMGWVGNALGIVADSYSGYKKGGAGEAAYQGTKSTVNTGVALGVFLDQGKNLAGKGPAVGGLAGFAGKMGLINSFTTAAGDAADYATGRKDLNLDNATGTSLDTVVALDPLKAVTSLASATKLVGVDTGIQNISISSIVDKGLGVVGLTEGKGEQIGDIKNETMNIYAAEQKRFQAGELDPSLRRNGSSSTPAMTDYKHLAAIRHQIAKYIPDGKIDGHDVSRDFDKIDMTKPENYMAYKQGINRAMLSQEKIKIDNSSYVPRWMRYGDSATKYNEAESQLNLLGAAEKEFGMFETKMITHKREQESQLAKQEQDKKEFAGAVSKLDKDGDGKISIAELNIGKSKDGKSNNVLDQDDLTEIRKIMSANGNKEAAERFEKSLAANGVKFDGSVAVNTPPAQTPTGETRNTQLAAR